MILSFYSMSKKTTGTTGTNKCTSLYTSRTEMKVWPPPPHPRTLPPQHPPLPPSVLTPSSLSHPSLAIHCFRMFCFIWPICYPQPYSSSTHQCIYPHIFSSAYFILSTKIEQCFFFLFLWVSSMFLYVYFCCDTCTNHCTKVCSGKMSNLGFKKMLHKF